MGRIENPFLSNFKLPVTERQKFGFHKCIAGAIHLCISDFIYVLERIQLVCIRKWTEKMDRKILIFFQKAPISTQGDTTVFYFV